MYVLWRFRLASGYPRERARKRKRERTRKQFIVAEGMAWKGWLQALLAEALRSVLVWEDLVWGGEGARSYFGYVHVYEHVHVHVEA